MITDREDLFSIRQLVTATGLATDNVIEVARVRSNTNKLFAQVETPFNNLTSLQIEFLASANADLSSPRVIADSGAIPIATLNRSPGYRFAHSIGVLRAGEKYLGARYTQVGTANSTGRITSGIVELTQTEADSRPPYYAGWKQTASPVVIPDVLPAYATMLAFGDSRTQQENIGATDGNSAYASGVGPINFAHAMDPRFNLIQWPDASVNSAIPNVSPFPYTQGWNQGENGATSAQMLTKIQNYIATHSTRPGFVILNIGVNEAVAATCWANIQASIAALQAWGVYHIIVTTIIGVRSGFAGQAAKNTHVFNTNALIRAGVAAYNDPKIRLADYQLYVKGDTADGPVPDANLQADFLHYNRRTAALAAGPLLTQIQAIVGSGNLFDFYIANYTNLLANYGVTNQAGYFLTTTGATLSGGVTGDGPAALVITGPGAGSTAVASAAAGGLQLVFTPSGAGNDNFTYTMLPASKTGASSSPAWTAANQWVRLCVEFEFDGWASFSEPTAQLERLTFDSTRFVTSMHYDGNPSIMSAGSFTDFTPLMQLDPSATGTYLPKGRFIVNANGAVGTGTAKIKRMAMIAFPTDPRLPLLG